MGSSRKSRNANNRAEYQHNRSFKNKEHYRKCRLYLCLRREYLLSSSRAQKNWHRRTIKQHILAGKLYIGESAGAMITAPNIEYACLMDDSNEVKELASFAALNVVDFSTVPHL